MIQFGMILDCPVCKHQGGTVIVGIPLQADKESTITTIDQAKIYIKKQIPRLVCLSCKRQAVLKAILSYENLTEYSPDLD